MISDLIGSVADTANKAVVDDAKKTVDDLQKLLAGPERAAIDIEKKKAIYTKGVDLSTPTGADAVIPAKPVDARATDEAAKSTLKSGKKIEFINFGYVHLDAANAFHADVEVNDTETLEPKIVPGRAPYYRAGVEREAVLLAGIARSVEIALNEKEQKEGGLGDLMTAAADLLGGAGGTATSATAADMKPFNEKVKKAFDAINKTEIKYSELHDAGMKLHEVRENLNEYLKEQIKKKKDGAPEPKGILSDLPLVGELPLPGEIGQIVSTFRKVGGKIYDVRNAMIFGLTLAMQPAMEKACREITLDAIRGRVTPIYPVWFIQPPPPAEAGQAPLADFQTGDVVGGDLKKIGFLDKINTGLKDAVSSVNSGINDATKKPMEIIEFLSKKVEPAPGHKYLDMAFQAGVLAPAPAQAGAANGQAAEAPAVPVVLFGGSEKLAEIAVASFYHAITDEMPGFMTGFVEDLLGYVFAVCVEFLRSVYRVLTSLPKDATISPDELAAAGSTHLLTHLVDFAISKLGLDEIIKKLTVTIPPAPFNVPGINWPQGDLSAAPIAEHLKNLLIEKISPYLEPVVNYAMAGLADRLNATRVWAGGSALTMEAHLAQLPTELALMFTNLFKPLWDFITDTLMEIISDVIGKALGPAAEVLGVAGDALGTASGFIADAQKKAQQAQAFAKNVEDKAGALMKELSNVKVGIGETGDLTDIEKAKDNLVNAVTADPFADNGGGGPGGGSNSSAPFPANREPLGKGKLIEKAEREELEKSQKLQFPTAIVEGQSAADAAANGAPAAAGGAAS